MKTVWTFVKKIQCITQTREKWAEMGNSGKAGNLDVKNAITIQGVIVTPQKGIENMEFITPYDLHRRWGRAISLKTLSNWRSLGLGPPYSKMGGRVLYRVSDVLTYEHEQRFATRF